MLRERLMRPSFIISAAGTFIICLAIIVVIGWLTHNIILIQIRPSYVPMQFNTALLFIFSGLGCLFVNTYPRISALFSIPIFSIAGLTFLEYLFNVNLGIDELFLRADIYTNSSYPGRIAPNTTICFLLLAIILIFQEPKINYANKYLFVFILSLLVSAISVTALFGYAANISTIYGWGRWTQMAVHTAFGLTLLGFAFSHYFWHQGKLWQYKNNIMLPISIFIFGDVIFILLWQALAQIEHQNVNKMTQNTTQYTEKILSTKMQEYFNGIERMKVRIFYIQYQNINEKVFEKIWRLDAQEYIKDYSSLMAIGLQTGSGVWIEQQQSSDKPIQSVFNSCIAEPNKFSFIKDKEITFLCKKSIINVNKKIYDLYVLFNITEFMDGIHFRDISNLYGMRLIYQDDILYENRANSNFIIDNWIQSQDVVLDGIPIKLQLWPIEKHIFKSMSWIPFISLTTGLLMTCFVALLVRLLQAMKASRDETMHAERKTQLIIEKTKEAYVAADDQSIIIEWNKQAEAMFGWTKEEILGKTLLETIIPSRYHEAHLHGMRHYLETGEGPVLGKRIELSGMRKNGEEFPVELSITPIEYEGKKIFSAFLNDITDRKQIEKMKNEFISLVSHELRTPLTSIHGALALLTSGVLGKFSFDVSELHQIARKNSERLIRLINDILDIEKMESGKIDFHFEPIDISQVIEEAVIDNKPIADKFSVRLKFVNPSPQIYVKADRDRLLQVLTNLISNAIKFSPINSEATLSIELKEDGKVRVSISDLGPGIPDAFKSRIFEKFSQADTSSMRAYTGTGLGLSISKAIIDRMRGTIGFDTIPNKGTTFYFDLPVIMQETQSYKKEIFKKVSTILICEPDEKNKKLILNMLNEDDYHLIFAKNAHEIKNIIAQQEIDALILSLILPDQDGLSLINELRHHSRFNHSPIVVTAIIGGKNKLQEINGAALNIVDWIENTSDTNRLLQAITKLKETITARTCRILHVEDDYDLAKIVASILRHEGELVNISTLSGAKKELENQHYDVVILDLKLPDGSGIQLLPYLSQHHIPTVIFTAYEFPKEYANEVSSVLIKSRSTYDQLRKAIKSAIPQGQSKNKK